MITPTQIKILAGVAVLASLCWLSYDYGATSVKEQWNAERAEINAKTADVLLKLNKHNSELSAQLEQAKATSSQVEVKIKTETVEVEKEVVKYVTKYRGSVCVADNDWLRIYKQSIDRTKAITASAK